MSLRLTMDTSAAATVERRTGVVQRDGHNYRDDGGLFYPLGCTLFWALYGWMHHDDDRVLENVRWAASQGVQYMRVLGQVDWPDETIDPNAPGYDAALASMLDAFYNCGVRTQITMIGGAWNGNLTHYCQQIVDAVKPRAEKVWSVEVANEAFQRQLTKPQIEQMTKTLSNQLPNIIAMSAPKDLADPTGQSAYAASWGADWFPVHLERTDGDHGWRRVRQSWDCKEIALPVSQNEPAGPSSSVASETDPLLLRMQRAVGILNGCGAFVFHSGAGVYGRAHMASTSYRPANLWEIDNVDTIMAAIGDATRLLPNDLPGWTHVNLAWVGFPFAQTGHSDKHYGATSGNRFVTMPCGIESITLTALS